MLVTPNQPGLPWVTPHSPVKQLSGFLPAIPELEGQTTSSAMGIYFIYFIYFLRFFCHKFSFLFVFGFFCLFVCLFLYFRAAPVAYGSSQARDWSGAAVAGHSNVRSATTMPDLSLLICDLHHSSWQYCILNPHSEARESTLLLMDISQVVSTELPGELLIISH